MPLNRHIILIGMMGTGKSSVGQGLAPLVKLPWVDTDHEVEKRAGRSISQLFAQEGEAGFRRWEKAVLSQVLAGRPTLITTGGGIVLDPDNVKGMMDRGWVVALKATTEELIRRLQGDKERPLLANDLPERVRHLALERVHAYDFAHFILDSTHLSREETVQRIWKEWSRRTGEHQV